MAGPEHLDDVPAILIVVPCFNEEKRLRPEAFVQYVQEHPETCFLFVDDGSTDSTRSIIEAACRQSAEHLSSLLLDENVGKAEAVRRGVLAACGRGASIVGYLDADLATPLRELGSLRAAMEQGSLDFVLGSRVALLGRSVQRSPLRHYLGRGFATTASLALGVRIYDTQCGAKLFRNTTLLRDVFQQPFRSRWAFDVEVLARFARGAEEGGQSISALAAEVPLAEWQDVSGSKVGIHGALGAAGELLHIWLQYGRHRSGLKEPRSQGADRPSIEAQVTPGGLASGSEVR